MGCYIFQIYLSLFTQSGVLTSKSNDWIVSFYTVFIASTIFRFSMHFSIIFSYSHTHMLQLLQYLHQFIYFILTFIRNGKFLYHRIILFCSTLQISLIMSPSIRVSAALLIISVLTGFSGCLPLGKEKHYITFRFKIVFTFLRSSKWKQA